MKLEIQRFGGRGATSSSSEYSLAVQERPEYKETKKFIYQTKVYKNLEVEHFRFRK